jgi:glycosyltransferase involved in cell wall biosynthesis
MTSKDSNDTLDLIIQRNVWQPNQPLRLHLGCGENYLEGYINIDFPPDAHTVMSVQADIYQDITQLQFPNDSVDEIRLHHVFEHFDRVTALALLIKWYEWLKIGGRLHIETPDLEGCAKIIASNASFNLKQAIIRHLFGSHEASWAYHLDGWSTEKFNVILTKFGFEVSSRTWQWQKYPYLPNVEAVSTKVKNLTRQELLDKAKEILYDYIVDNEAESELKMLNIWFTNLTNLLNEPNHSKKETPRLNSNKGVISCVFFSKDRPMQLDASLKSFLRNCLSSHKVNLKVIYKCSNERFENQYKLLISEYHNNVEFIKENNFKIDVLEQLRGSDFVIFCVDDTIFTHRFSLDDIIVALEKYPDAIGFSLRLGMNTIYCYPLKKYQRLPNFEHLENDILELNWVNAEADFGYPLELSSSVYRTKDIFNLIESLSFVNPNTLEAQLEQSKSIFYRSKPNLLCFKVSVAFSVPLNLVQTAWRNRVSNNENYSPDKLLELFENGFRIDIEQLQGFIPNACHQEVELNFQKTKQSNLPLVSVIIPCYNLAEYLPEAVESVVKQTFSDWECIIVNDGSTDNTSEVAKEIISKYPDKRIYLLEKENGGPAAARNFGIKHSKGKFILPLDADDLIHPSFLEKTVNVLLNNTNVHIVYTDLQEFGERSNLVLARDWNPAILRFQNHLNYCSLYCRDVWETVGGYDTEKKIIGYEDWDFWVGCAEKGFNAQRIPEPILLYRIRKVSTYTQAIERDLEKKALIVLNHPSLYGKSHIIWANAVLRGEEWTKRLPNVIGVIPPSIPEEVLPPRRDAQLYPDFQIKSISTPKVSVIVPTFNRPTVLKNAIQSIINQTFQDFEIIVVNDAGEDVRSVVESFNDKRIQYISHSQNKKLAAARNTGIRSARGKYIAYLDDDDVFLPKHLETLVNFLENNSEYKVAYTDAFRSHQNKVNDSYVTFKKDIPYSQDFDSIEILFGNYIPVICIVHHKQILNEVGLFDETLTTHEDWDLWIRISRKYPFHHIKQVTCEFSWREDGSTMTSSIREDFYRTRSIIYLKNKPLFQQEIERAIADGNLELAERIVAKLLNIFDPKYHPEPLIDLGVIRSLQSRYDEAIQIFQKVLELHPGNEIAYENLKILSEKV